MTTEPTTEQTTEVTDNTTPEGIKNLRDAANRSAANKAEADAARRELAFVKAGVDTDKPLVKQLMASYKGELTKDAVDAYLTELELDTVLKPQPATTPAQPETTTPEVQTPEITDDEHAAQNLRREVASGATPPDGKQDAIHPVTRGMNAFNDAIAKGEQRETAAGAYFKEVFEAAGKGDERVLIK